MDAIAEAGPMAADAAGATPVSATDFAWLFNGKAGAAAVPADAAIQAFARSTADAARRVNGFVWVHCHIASLILAGLRETGAIDPVPFDLLSAAETRPRCVMHGKGVFLNLRGRALDAMEGEGDLGALRLWLVPGGVITTWRRPLSAIEELLQAQSRGFRPHSPGAFVARLCGWLIDSIEPMVDDLSETVDELEIDAVDGGEHVRSREMSEVRRDAIELRRFLYPQRDAISTFLIEHANFVTAGNRAKIHEAYDRLVRYIDELEVTRERCTVLHDEIIDNRSIQMNRQILVLSVVSAVLLPVTMVAGMFGMNLQGIPWADSPLGFWIVTGVLAAAVLVEIAILRWFRVL